MLALLWLSARATEQDRNIGITAIKSALGLGNTVPPFYRITLAVSGGGPTLQAITVFYTKPLGFSPSAPLPYGLNAISKKTTKRFSKRNTGILAMPFVEPMAIGLKRLI
jgi:hypothetical protein